MDLQYNEYEMRKVYDERVASVLAEAGAVTDAASMNDRDRLAVMNRLIDMFAAAEGSLGSSIFSAIMAVARTGCGIGFAPACQAVAMIKRQQEMMAGSRGKTMRRARARDFALGDEVLRAEAAHPEKPVRDRATRVVKEIAAQNGEAVGDVRDCRLLAAAFPPGHEARTHPHMPVGVLHSLARMTAADCDRWYPRLADRWQPSFEAGGTWQDLFFAMMDAPAKYR